MQLYVFNDLEIGKNLAANAKLQQVFNVSS